MTADAQDNAGGAVQTETKVVQMLKSDKLDALKVSYQEAWQKMLNCTDPFAHETKDAKLAVWKIEGEIKAEETAIQKALNDAKIEEQRNQRLALNSNQLAAYAALLAERAKKSPDAAKVAELQAAFDTSKEAVDNELLAKYAASRPAKKAPESASGETTTGTAANTAAIIELYLAGKTHREIEDAGFKRSTVWHAINNYKKANSLS